MHRIAVRTPEVSVVNLPGEFLQRPERADLPHSQLAAPGTPVAVLVERSRDFLAFLERRVRNREAAEDILQTAQLKSLEKVHALRDDQSVVSWFYRILRNQVADHFRRHSAEQRALERHGTAAPLEEDIEGEALPRTPCRCVARLLPTLPPQYAALLQRVELESASVSEVAAEQGLSANNVRVRLHRARQALRRRVEQFCGTCSADSCFDCMCPARPEASRE